MLKLMLYNKNFLIRNDCKNVLISTLFQMLDLNSYSSYIVVKLIIPILCILI